MFSNGRMLVYRMLFMLATWCIGVIGLAAVASIGAWKFGPRIYRSLRDYWKDPKAARANRALEAAAKRTPRRRPKLHTGRPAAVCGQSIRDMHDWSRQVDELDVPRFILDRRFSEEQINELMHLQLPGGLSLAQMIARGCPQLACAHARAIVRSRAGYPRPHLSLFRHQPLESLVLGAFIYATRISVKTP